MCSMTMVYDEQSETSGEARGEACVVIQGFFSFFVQVFQSAQRVSGSGTAWRGKAYLSILSLSLCFRFNDLSCLPRSVKGDEKAYGKGDTHRYANAATAFIAQSV